MAVLGIFSVKTFHLHDGQAYTYGGFGKYLAAMCESFDQVVLLCKVKHRPPGEGFYIVEHDNLKIVHVPSWPSELGAMFVQPLVLIKGLKIAKDCDVIHARMPDWTGLTGATLARIFGTPCFHQIVDDWSGLARTIPWKKAFGLGLGLKGALLLYDWLERWLSKGQLVFAQGQAAYAKHYAAAERVLVLSTSHRRSDAGTVRPKMTGDTISVLNVGRLNAVKNQQLLIRAIARLHATDRRWRLRIVGEGGKRGELQELVRTLGIQGVVSMPGLTPHGPLLWAEFDQADIFALSSVSEGTPKVVLEAMVRGCPVVASAVSGVPTAVQHEERGLLFQSGDIDELVCCLQRMASDGALRTQCQGAAFAFSLEHSIEAATHLMLEKIKLRWPQLVPLRKPDV